MQTSEYSESIVKHGHRWDIFCAVVDNYGDIGTCWRLAQQLANEHEADVRLWVDDLGSFAKLSPSVLAGVATQHLGPIEICHWKADFPIVDPADVVIEAFACELPESYLAAMARRPVVPVWINLEYLSAEGWVEECHLLMSPHPELPLTKTFFFPGFTSGTGGLLRERDLLADRAAFDPRAKSEFWRQLQVNLQVNDEQAPALDDAHAAESELRISLFCYENAALPSLLQCWADGPDAVRVFVTPGAATEQTARWLGQELRPGARRRKQSLTVDVLPFLSQTDFDRLLWACDVNFVRGEDSFVRAQWAQQPFVWQIYPQAENVHTVKLDAFLSQYLGEFAESDVVRRCWQAWNGTGDMPVAWREFAAKRRLIQQYGKDWACQLDRTGDLANNLARFVRGK